VAIATVVERRGSAPRDPGASLALNDLGEIAGSVTGGCVEPSVIREAQEVLDGGAARLTRVRDRRRHGVRGRPRVRRHRRRS
jgi:xanthine dehydrogenase accessory factor